LEQGKVQIKALTEI